MRYFLAFEVPREPFKDLIEKLSNYRISRFFHVTLSFFGSKLPDMNYITNYFSNKPPFIARFKEVSGFPDPYRARVVWVRVITDVINDFKLEKNDILHLTIARGKNIDCTKYEFQGYEMLVKTIKLFQTIIPGRSYKVIKEINLKNSYQK